MKAIKTPKTSLDTKSYLTLTKEARTVYDNLTDYLLSTTEPGYSVLCKYRKQISEVEDSDSRTYLIEFFNNDPLINYPLIPSDPWTYYVDNNGDSEDLKVHH